MIERIVSGGQTGADRAGLDAAIACGIPHGGWCPKGRKAEDGPIPDEYQLTETASGNYLDRTERNVKESDGTVILTMGPLSGGSSRTAEFAREHDKPWLHVKLDAMSIGKVAGTLRRFAKEHGLRVLNVAGSRGSKEPELHRLALNTIMAMLHPMQDLPLTGEDAVPDGAMRPEHGH